MQVHSGRIALFERHCNRLRYHANRLALDFDISQFSLVARQQAQNLGNGVLKVLVCSDDGGRGYARAAGGQTRFTITQHALPNYYIGWQKEGVALGVSDIKLGLQPLLAGLKHLNRLEQVMIKEHLSESDFDDVLVTDIENRLIEASAANVFLMLDGAWYTPELSLCGVAGVMREFVIERLGELGRPVTVKALPLCEVERAEAIAITNALMEIVPVKTVSLMNQSKEYDISPVVQLRQELAKAYQEEYDAGY